MIFPEDPDKTYIFFYIFMDTWSRCRMSMLEYFEGAQQGRRIDGRPEESRDDCR